MKIYPIHTGNFKLDGGAMFGVVPKVLWSRTNPPDENNMCSWAMRSMLIDTGERKILIDTGIGNKQSEKFLSHYHLHGPHSTEKSLAEHGLSKDDITDVFLTHLHFDHVGGAVEWNDDKTGYRPAFKNATYWTNKRHWEWATNPNAREKASFLKENIIPLEESGQLKFIDVEDKDGVYPTPLPFDIWLVSGHTDAQMCPMIEYQGKTLVFMADLLPSVGHIPLPYIMGYDTRPLISLEEKEKFMEQAAEKNYYLFLEHDNTNEVCTVQQTEKGVRLKETYSFSEIFN